MIQYKLDNIIREFLVRKGKNTEHEYFRYLVIAQAGLRDLNMDVSGMPKAVILDVNDNLTVDLPNDYIKYMKIALCSDGGKIKYLGYAKDMCLLRSPNDCGTIARTVADSSEGIVSVPEAGTYRNGELMGRMFGLGGGGNRNGYYRIDHEKNMITLSSDHQSSYIYLEYLADMKRIDGETIVHPYEIEALKAWIDWEIKESSRTYGLGETVVARKHYRNEKRLCRARFKTFTKEEAYQTIRKSFKLSIKV
jgi:hypothetical protein